MTEEAKKEEKPPRCPICQNKLRQGRVNPKLLQCPYCGFVRDVTGETKFLTRAYFGPYVPW